MNRLKHYSTMSLLIALSLSLMSCGFHFRSAKQVPSPLKNLCLTTPKSKSGFNSSLSSMLRSLDIKLIEPCNGAPFVLTVFDITLTHDNPAIADANQAVTFNYTLNADIALSSAQGKTIIPRRVLSASRIVILNSQQIFVPYNSDSIETQLQHMIISQIYDQLTSLQTRHALETLKTPRKNAT